MATLVVAVVGGRTWLFLFVQKRAARLSSALLCAASRAATHARAAGAIPPPPKQPNKTNGKERTASPRPSGMRSATIALTDASSSPDSSCPKQRYWNALSSSSESAPSCVFVFESDWIGVGVGVVMAAVDDKGAAFRGALPRRCCAAAVACCRAHAGKRSGVCAQ